MEPRGSSAASWSTRATWGELPAALGAEVLAAPAGRSNLGVRWIQPDERRSGVVPISLRGASERLATFSSIAHAEREGVPRAGARSHAGTKPRGLVVRDLLGYVPDR
jgi:hypothetical protein